MVGEVQRKLFLWIAISCCLEWQTDVQRHCEQQSCSFALLHPARAGAHPGPQQVGQGAPPRLTVPLKHWNQVRDFDIENCSYS